MYENVSPVLLTASVSSLFNNLDVLPTRSQGEENSFDQKYSYLTVHKRTAHITEQINASCKYHQVNPQETTSQGVTIFDAKWCKLVNEIVLVIGYSNGFQIFDDMGHALLFFHNNQEKGLLEEGHDFYSRGIAAIDDFILVGASDGKVIVVETVAQNTFSISETVSRHQRPLTYIATNTDTSISDKINVITADDEGMIVLWNFEGKMKYISKITAPASRQPCTAVCFLKHDLLGASYFSGHIRFFDLNDKTIKIDITAHGAPITSMDHFLGSDYSMLVSTAEDTFVRVWKIENKDKLQVTQVWFTSIPHQMNLGVKFIGSDNMIGVTGYDSKQVVIFRKT